MSNERLREFEELVKKLSPENKDKLYLFMLWLKERAGEES